VVYDLHSKWPEVTTVGSVTAKVLINILDSLFARWGLAKKIPSDNGPQMVSHELSSYLVGKGIHHIRTEFYRPAENGGRGVWNTWHKGARSPPVSSRRCCTTRHATTGVSSASLMLGQAPPYTGSVQATVFKLQRLKDRFDRDQRVRPPAITVSNWVRIRQPHRNNKLQSFWSDPVQVGQQFGPASSRLADGTRWHAGRLRLRSQKSHSM